MNQARKEIHCDSVYEMGITGAGVGVAVLDTGIYPHEDQDNFERLIILHQFLILLNDK